VRGAYYNEIDPYAAQWLRNLIAGGHIAPGDVDERDIREVRSNDVQDYAQAHFFAGIGGWSLALRIAGWHDDARVWTGSCPCQPVSSAGQQKGHADERHLWPAFHHLITECRPTTIFGEQVASKDGREWYSAVRADLEALGYACGAADLCAASVGASCIRQRLFWVADAAGEGRRRRATVEAGRRAPPGGSGAPICFEPWPDGRGSRSALTVPDVLAPSYGIPGRVGQLRAYGNAIVPQVGAAFVAAFYDLQ
jgi:DNA (cytosine-5)-methyltransferase 1